MNLRRTIAVIFVVLISILLPLRSGAADTFDLPGITVTLPSDEKLSKTRIDSIWAGEAGVVWGTGAGVLWEKPDGTKSWFDRSNSPFKVEEFPGALIYQGHLWLGVRNPAAGQGLFRFDGKEWTQYHPRLNEMLSELVTCLLADGKDRLWIGYEERGIDQYVGHEYGKKTLRLFGGIKVKHGLLPGEVFAMVESGDSIWVGQSTGLSRFDPSKKGGASFQNWNGGKEFPAQAAFALVPDGAGKIVAGTDVGVVVPAGDGWKVFGRKEGVLTFPVKSIVSDGRRFWFGTDNGLQALENGRVSNPVKIANGGLLQEIRCLCFSRNLNGSGRLLVGTENGARIIPLP